VGWPRLCREVSCGDRSDEGDRSRALAAQVCPRADVRHRVTRRARGPRARSAAEAQIPRLVLYGNIAGTLNAAGNPQAAIALERLWDSLTRDLPFLTVCGYDASALSDSGPDVWSAICAPHPAVA
jgi:hypothetical protein